MPDDLTTELLKRSWANPDNRPPRDPVKWKPVYNEPTNPFKQKIAIEDALKVLQPSWNQDPDTGGLPSNGQGGLNVVTDPQAITRDSDQDFRDQQLIEFVRTRPDLFPNGIDDIQDLLDNRDEDWKDNQDQSPLEQIQRRRLALGSL